MARRTLAEVERELKKAQAEATRLAKIEANFEEYKKRVREEAIQVSKEMDWCEDGLNRSLRKLDLEEYDNYKHKLMTVKMLIKWEDDDGGDPTEGEFRFILREGDRYSSTDYEIADFVIIKDGEVKDGWPDEVSDAEEA